MPKDSGVGPNSHATFGGHGAVTSLGDAFQPNLAMGGGSYKIPIDLPSGPGGLSPKLELLYDTSAGNGPFGLGWGLSLPTIERRRPRAFMADGEPEFNLAGLPLVKTGAGDYVASVSQQLQRFARDGDGWISRTSMLVELRFGSTAASRVEQTIDGTLHTERWHLDRMRFPGGRDIVFEYLRSGNLLLPRTVRWSVFRLEFLYEDRPDPWSQFDAGFEVRVTQRCRRIEIHQDRLPDTLTRALDLEYVAAEHTRTSLLARATLTGFRRRNGVIETSALPSLTFDYTTFNPEARQIERMTSSVVPPPGLGEDVTLTDLGGSALPGLFRLDGTGGTYWENRGGLRWGPPQALTAVPAGIALSDRGVRFADMEGRGTADLVVGLEHGGGYYPNRPGEGFSRKRTATIAPTFDLGEADSHLVDLDGDRVSDLLTFRNGTPLAFFNRGDGSWRGPVVLADSGLPSLTGLSERVRVVDMCGNGRADVVLLRSRQIVYWPYLGDGRWGAARTMAGSPDFGNADVERDLFLADLNGDGAADLVVVRTSEIHLYLNRAGEGFAEPIVLTRTPRAAFDRLLLADMKGSGTAGLLFTSPAGQGGRSHYWFLDLLAGVKPNLLARIDNGCGFVTEVTYSTSAVQRARDLDAGRRWTGYLPFVVPIVERVRLQDAVTGETSTSVYRYHDGHFDGSAREYLGFAEVECTRTNGPQEPPLQQRLYYHTRHTTARDPAFIAGRGQPHRTETFDPDAGALLQLEESTWEARTVAGTGPDTPAYLALETRRSSQRLDGGIAYESEEAVLVHDAIGNVVRETRTSRWNDSTGSPQADVIRIEHTYTSHATLGPTSIRARMRKIDGSGALLKDMRFHYDGAPMVGLPLGEVEQGFRVRQCEVALTPQQIAAAYDGVAPPQLATLYQTEIDPDFGLLHLRDVGRARVDAFGNEVETIDARGLTRLFTFDAESIHPVAVAEDGGPPRATEFDPIAQQVSRVEDLNGFFTQTEFDALGNVLAVFKRDAAPGLPTEEYEYRRGAVPHSVVAAVRVNANDAQPGYRKIDYLDGCGRRVQTRLLGEDGRWAVGKQERMSIQGRKLRVVDGYFSDHDTFDAAPPAGTAEHETRYDTLGRVIGERLFNGRRTVHRYAANRVEFFDPDAADALALDPSTPPSRESVTDASGLVRSIVERDGASRFEQRRDYDALRRLLRIVDPLGHVTLENVYDLWGNRLRVRSTEGGVTTFVFSGGSDELQRTDADGRVLQTSRDARGRAIELRDGGGTLLESYAYDTGAGANLAGRLARVAGQFGTKEYSYSPEGHATAITCSLAGVAGTFVTRFEYNSQQQVTRVVYPDGGEVQYQYAPTGMLRAIPGFVDRIEYGATGLRERLVYANGLETRRAYSPGDYLITELLTQPAAGGHRYQHLVYELDGVGQATHVDDLSTVPGKMRLSQQYIYDARHRLVHAAGSVATFDFAYTYDDLGNLTSNGETGTAFEYGLALGDPSAPNRLVRRMTSATPEYAYDASGNLTRDPDLGELTYDDRHRLVRIARPNGSTVEYRYDHNDRRVLTLATTNGVTEQRVEIEGLFIVEDGTASRVVFDEGRRLAVVPSAGDPLVHHFDRLGNVNVISNGTTGAFVGHDEYTPYGRLFVSIVIQPAFTFQGGRFSDGLELVLLGARHYRPGLGRFLTCDPYLIINQEKIPPLVTGGNLYVYAYCNPTNFTDVTGEIAPLVIAIIVAAIVGAVIGAIGAGVNGAETWDEWFVWIIGGAIGGVLTVLFWYGILVWFGVACATAALAATIITLGASVLGLFTPLLDNSDSGVAWAFSWAIKLIKSPVFTILGLFAVIGFAIAGKKVDFRRGALFVETGDGTGGITLGAIVYTQSGLWDGDQIRDDVAKHEAYHTRTIAVLGEWGFYVTYLTFGGIFAAATGGDYLGLDTRGCGNPFEKHAYTYFNHHNFGPNPMEVSASDC